jgi:hypothetical protein
MSTAAFALSNSTTAVANWTPTASHCTLQSCFVLHSALTIVACGLVLTLCPSLIVTLLARPRIQVSTATTTYEHSVPAARSLYDSQNATETFANKWTRDRPFTQYTVFATPDNIPVTPRRLHSRPAARSRNLGSSSNGLQVAVAEEIVYSTSNRDPMSTPKVRSLRASVHGFYTSGGFFKFTGGGTYLIRHPLLRRFKFKYSPTHGYTLRVPNHIQLGSIPASYMHGGHVIWKN